MSSTSNGFTKAGSTRVATAQRKVRFFYIYEGTVKYFTNLFIIYLICAIQQFGELGSSLATLVSHARL